MKKLCVAFLRSFRRQHSEKMKGSARGNWDPREGQQPFRPNPNEVEDRTATLRQLLIGAVRLDFVLVVVVRFNAFISAGLQDVELVMLFCKPIFKKIDLGKNLQRLRSALCKRSKR